MATFRTLKAGMSGQDVKNLQITMITWSKQLNRPDFDPGIPDGKFGTKTKSAIMAFQNALGLKIDGIVGPRTWDAIQKAGEVLVTGQNIELKPPMPSGASGPSGSVTRADLAPSPIASGAGMLNSLMGSMNINWKMVGIVTAVGIGLLFIISPKSKGRRRR